MKGVKIAVAVVCLLLAAFFVVRNSRGGDDIPDTPDSATGWMCRACKHEFSLTARQFDQEERRVSSKQDRGTGPLKCPSCGKEDAWRANRCQTHGVMYFVMGVPNEKGVCPQCHPEPEQKTAVQETPNQAPVKKSVPLQ